MWGDMSKCVNANCPIRFDCMRFVPYCGAVAGYTTLFRPERRRDGKVWCAMFKDRKG